MYTILVALQFSVNPKKILEEAFKVARKYEGRIFVIHVIEEKAPYSFYYDSYQFWEEFRNSAIKESLAMLLNLIKEVDCDCGDIEPIIEVGDPCDKIIETADRLEADLIITGHRVHAGIDKLFHTGISEKIVKLSKRPVLSFYIS